MVLRRLVVLLALAIGALAQPAPPNPHIEAVENGLTDPVVLKGRLIQRHNILQRMQALGVPGVSIAVVHNYQVEWAKGYGLADIAGKRSVTPETLFQAASISKPVAVTAAMKLVEDHELDLDEDVNVKLQSWKLPENQFTKTAKVTLRRIMSHSAGLTVHGFPGYAAGDTLPTVPEILDGRPPANTEAVRVDVVPGSIGRYSGGGITIMQLLMTDVTMRDFPSLMRETVLTKAGMKHSTYQQPLPANLRDVAATGYSSKVDPIPGKYHTYPEMAAAGLWTTPSDLANFGIEIQKSREGRSNRILKQQTVEWMLTEQKAPFGLGFQLEASLPYRRFGHGGSNEGFRCMMTFSYNGDGVVVMTNSDNGSPLAGEILLAVARAYDWPDAKPREREAITLSQKDLDVLAGEYEGQITGPIRVRTAGDHITISAEGLGTAEYYPQSAGVFFALREGAPDIRFTKNDQGAITGLSAGRITARKVK